MINENDIEKLRKMHIKNENEIQKIIEDEIIWDTSINISSKMYRHSEISVIVTISLVEEFLDPSRTAKDWILLELLNCKEKIKEDKSDIIRNRKDKENIQDLKSLKSLFEKYKKTLRSYTVDNNHYCLSNLDKDKVTLSITQEIDRASKLQIKSKESQIKKTCFENIKHILKVDGLKKYDYIAKHIMYINDLSISKNNDKEYLSATGTIYKITLEEKKRLNIY